MAILIALTREKTELNCEVKKRNREQGIMSRDMTSCSRDSLREIWNVV